MGDMFDLTVQLGVGMADVTLLGPCESPVAVTGRITGTPPKNIGEPLRTSAIIAKIGVGEQAKFVDPITGHEITFWPQTAHLTISDAGVAWYELNGKHDRLDVGEEPQGSDTYVLSKDGQFMGRVTLNGVEIAGVA